MQMQGHIPYCVCEVPPNNASHHVALFCNVRDIEKLPSVVLNATEKNKSQCTSVFFNGSQNIFCAEGRFSLSGR
eukprot:JP439365.1.p3 GENE.JP439365.1~~JP439365.1.p3  ORF type:complete len:74 (-),score=8.51 JP439365.1:56-277(-)